MIGALRMTALDALSPFYRVPISTSPIAPPHSGYSNANEIAVRPSSMHLRFLACGSPLLNWVSWLSRMETYSAMGISRLYNYALSNPLATSVLRPMTLGCGQAPLLDLWPLWLLRRLINFSIRLSATPLHPLCQSLRILFPFSDIDEI